MAIPTTIETPLQGLLVCSHCGDKMIIRGKIGTRERFYHCPVSQDAEGREHKLPMLSVRKIDNMLVTAILEAVLTGENAKKVATALNLRKATEQDSPGAVTEKDIRSLLKEPEAFVKIIGGAETTRNFLGSFIDRIEADGATAKICYSIPLPQDNKLPEQHLQVVQLE